MDGEVAGIVRDQLARHLPWAAVVFWLCAGVFGVACWTMASVNPLLWRQKGWVVASRIGTLLLVLFVAQGGLLMWFWWAKM